MKTEMFKKSVGFYLILALGVMMVLTAAVYAGTFASNSAMSWVTFVALILGFAGSVVLLLAKKTSLIPYFGFILTLVALIAFAMSSYQYILDAIIGIDVHGLAAGFVASMVLLGLTVILSFFDLAVQE